MTFDPSLYYQHGPITDPNAPDTSGISDAEAMALLGGGTNGQFVTLPDGRYVLIDPKTGRIIQDFGVKPASAGGGAATGGQYLANQQQQASLAQGNEQFYQNMGYEKARFGIEQEQRRAEAALAQANNTRDFAAAQHWQQVSQDLRQQQLQLDQQKQQFDQYNTLATLASNPRNFVQTFFMNRGQSAPPDVARYGNTIQTAADIVPFQQFQQRFMGAAGAPSATAPAAGNQFGSTQNNPNNPYAGTNVNYGGSPTVADTAMINGVKTWAGGAYSGRPVADSPANAGDLTPYLQNPNLPDPTGRVNQVRQYAQGGKLQMMGPHAVINLMTGRTVAIAGEAGPETAYFDGAAIIDPGINTDPYGGGYMPGSEPGAGVGLAGTTIQPSGSQYLPGSEPSPFTPPAIPPQSVPQQTWTPQQLQQMITSANTANAPQATPTPTVTQPYGGTGITTQPGITPQPPAPIGGYPINQPILPWRPPDSIIQQPGATPQTRGGLTTYSNPNQTSNMTPRNVAPPGTFGSTVPSQMPSYLAGENFQAANPVTEAVRNLPFMKRLYAQGRGDPTQGTNTPQRSDLPPDLPLVSRLAWQQLAPSEQQALLSYVSSLGVTPEDYLAMIGASSPQGGVASAPLFGNQTPFSKQ